MAALLWLATRMAALHPPAHGLAQAIPVVLLIAGGAFVYLLLLALFGIAGWRETVEVIRRGKPRDLRS
jgi:putative peptidoglycan lipid II flippase